MPEEIITQEPAPDAQVDVAPKAVEPPDYKSFFDSHVEKEQSRLAELNEKLSMKGISEANKLAMEREAFNIEKQLHQFNVKQPTKDSVVEDLVALDLKPGNPQYDFLKSMVNQAEDISEAKSIIAAFSEFLKVGKEPNPPANLNDRPTGDGVAKKDSKVGFSSADIT